MIFIMDIPQLYYKVGYSFVQYRTKSLKNVGRNASFIVTIVC